MEERKLYFGELYSPWNPGFGDFAREDGGAVQYVFTGLSDESYLLLRDYDEARELTETYVCSKAGVKRMDQDKVTVGSGNYIKYCSTLEERSEPTKRDEIVRELSEMGEERGEGPNDVQTKREAEISQDQGLIKQMMGMYTPVVGKCPEDYKQTQVMIKNEVGGVIFPISLTVFSCVYGQFTSCKTIWFRDKLLICDKVIKIENHKKFMYENIKKSSKLSFGIGLSLGGMGGSVLAGPKEGDSVYSNGKPMLGGGGSPISFNMSYCKTYERLTLKAEQDIIASAEMKCETIQA